MGEPGRLGREKDLPDTFTSKLTIKLEVADTPMTQVDTPLACLAESSYAVPRPSGIVVFSSIVRTGPNSTRGANALCVRVASRRSGDSDELLDVPVCSSSIAW